MRLHQQACVLGPVCVEIDFTVFTDKFRSQLVLNSVLDCHPKSNPHPRPASSLAVPTYETD